MNGDVIQEEREQRGNGGLGTGARGEDTEGFGGEELQRRVLEGCAFEELFCEFYGRASGVPHHRHALLAQSAEGLRNHLQCAARLCCAQLRDVRLVIDENPKNAREKLCFGVARGGHLHESEDAESGDFGDNQGF